MPSVPEAFVLGLLHGPAELLPVSSSAHVGLALRVRGEPPSKDLEVALHAGTLVALGPRRPSWLLVFASLPAAVAGALLERPVEQRLGGPRTVAAGLVAGGAAMAVADAVAPRRRRRLRAAEGWWVGLAQALALWPGVSRLGATLTAARLLGLRREEAWELALSAGVPVLAGATALRGWRLARRLAAGEDPGARILAAGAAGSALSTALAARTAARRPAPALWPFALYRAALAGTVLL